MPVAIRFHLDEDVDPAVAAGLRQRGIEVTTSLDAGLRGATDAEQLAFGVAERRVVVTHDADLLRLHRAGVQHAGIAFCSRERRAVGGIVRALVLIHEILAADDMAGHVEFL